jgi:signal transduction histidine kinase
LNISKSLIQASSNLVIIEQSSKAGVIYSSLISDESEVSQGTKIQTHIVDFDHCIAQSVEMFEEGKLAIKQINLKCKFEPIGQISSSKYHLRIIINNLIANAINYTPQNGNISLIVTAKISNV